MNIIYKTGDLMAAEEGFICHGCNAQGKMGSGVARLIRDQRPAAYDAYMAEFLNSGLVLGQTIWAKDDKGWVINAITQEYYGDQASEGVVYVSYDAVRTAIAEINLMAVLTQGDPAAREVFGEINAVAFPLIGAGLAGGSWKTIARIIEEEAVAFQPVVYLIDGVVPTN